MLRFPQDEQAHAAVVEWWYFNGHLNDSSGGRYAFMDCLFKVNKKAVQIPFLNTIPYDTVYFHHSLISDIDRKKFFPRVNYICIPDAANFSKPLLYIRYTSPAFSGTNLSAEYLLEESQPWQYILKDSALDLRLESVKPALLEGGEGFVDFGSKTTYYYSLTHLKTEGAIKAEGQWIPVKGKSWMDHQWSDTGYAKDRWTWFSIQLDNDIEIICFEYDEQTGKRTYLADIVAPDGSATHLNEVKLEPLDKVWKSPKTGTVYPIAWKIIIPSKGIELELTSLAEDHEMVFGTIHYWEGPLGVKGRCMGQEVLGVGFLELVGYS